MLFIPDDRTAASQYSPVSSRGERRAVSADTQRRPLRLVQSGALDTREDHRYSQVC